MTLRPRERKREPLTRFGHLEGGRETSELGAEGDIVVVVMMARFDGWE